LFPQAWVAPIVDGWFKCHYLDVVDIIEVIKIVLTSTIEIILSKRMNLRAGDADR